MRNNPNIDLIMVNDAFNDPNIDLVDVSSYAKFGLNWFSW